ncbi:MAG: hypothetical protein IKU02_10060 [Bacteroidaceae bacterium]|nr:hypothetical protein [Bacteroidaceae bacterium]
MVLTGIFIYKGFKPGCEIDGKLEGIILLQLGAGTLKVMGYHHQIRGLREGDYIRCTVTCDNYGYIYLESAKLDADQTLLNRIVNESE